MFKRNTRLPFFFLVYDIVLMSAAFLMSASFKYGGLLDVGRYYLVLPIIVLSWIVVKSLAGGENFHFRNRLLIRIREQFLDFLLFTGIVSFTILALELKLYSRIVLFGTISGFFLLRNIGYLAIYRYLAYMRSKGRHVAKVLILGAGGIGEQLGSFIAKNQSLGYQVVGYLDDDSGNSDLKSGDIVGGLDDLEGLLKSQHVDELIIALPLTVEDKIQKALELADFYGLRVKLVPDYYRLFKRTFRTSELGNMPTVNLRQIPLDYLFNAMMKRGFDLIFASVALIVLTPFMLIISVIIILDAPGPILYRPVRVGEGGKKFQCLKFRTMFENEDSVYNKKSTQIGDKRITRVGAILRKYNIDELPQFVNVLKSEMSVVGPRPHRTFLNESMQKQVGGYMIRHYIKPGITGWAQVNGWRGPTETFEQKSQRTQHDLWYIENWSFWLDLEIVSKTVFGKTSKKNAF